MNKDYEKKKTKNILVYCQRRTFFHFINYSMHIDQCVLRFSITSTENEKKKKYISKPEWCPVDDDGDMRQTKSDRRQRCCLV